MKHQHAEGGRESRDAITLDEQPADGGKRGHHDGGGVQ